MDNKKEKLLRLCSFYVSDWHLVTMLLPYINNKINEQTKIATIIENDIEENVITLVNKLNLKNADKILGIDWRKKGISKYSYISKFIENNIGNDILLLVNGSKEYIDFTNKNIEKYLEKSSDKLQSTNTKLTIVDCYEIVEFNGNIIEILDEHDKILNTSGEKEITDVFEDYVRKEKIS